MDCKISFHCLTTRVMNMILNFCFITEIKSVAALLGVSGVALYRGFTTRTRNTRGQLCKSLADVNTVCILPRKCSIDLQVMHLSVVIPRAKDWFSDCPILQANDFQTFPVYRQMIFRLSHFTGNWYSDFPILQANYFQTFSFYRQMQQEIPWPNLCTVAP